MTEGPQRRLAAILAADVAGYSRLMSEDEVGRLADLRELRREVLAPAVTEHKGNIVKGMGDGWLVEFASVTDGINCAIRVQEALADHARLKLRIGLHVGDVTSEEEDIYGDGVNVAVRLQELVEPREIAISGVARSAIDRKLSTNFEDTGTRELKNIPEPVQVWRWSAAKPINSAIVDVSRPVPGFDGRPAIAVLAFENLSRDREQEFLADGLAEDILTRLATRRWLPVIARNSSFTYKGRSVDSKKIGTELGARYILEGSVRKAGQRIRVTGQLIDTDNGHHVWAERYDRDLAR